MLALGRIEAWIKQDGSILVSSTGTKASASSKQKLWAAGEYGLLEGSIVYTVNGSFPITLDNGRWRIEK